MTKNDFDTRDLYKIDIDTKKIERITNIPHSRQSYAQFSEDGKKDVIFIRCLWNHKYLS